MSEDNGPRCSPTNLAKNLVERMRNHERYMIVIEFLKASERTVAGPAYTPQLRRQMHESEVTLAIKQCDIVQNGLSHCKSIAGK